MSSSSSRTFPLKDSTYRVLPRCARLDVHDPGVAETTPVSERMGGQLRAVVTPDVPRTAPLTAPKPEAATTLVIDMSTTAIASVGGAFTPMGEHKRSSLKSSAHSCVTNSHRQRG